MTAAVLYQIQAIPEKRLFEVKCTILNPDPGGQKVLLPVWIPGSYLVRDFARFIMRLQAYCQEKPIYSQMLDKNTWRFAPTAGPLEIHYQVHAYDLTPRGAHVDNTHAFFNGSRVFLQICGQENAALEIEIQAPSDPKYHHWRVATSLETAGATPLGFGLYKSSHYEDLIDHPVEIGEFEVFDFEAAGVPHALVMSGKYKADLPRLKADLANICEHHIHFFDTPAPMKKYVFLVQVLNEGYGGLEHCSSSVIHCKRDHLPKLGEVKVSEGYRTLLGLLSHEYFHAWNVKRIKPSAFLPYDLTKENYTRQLWIFEGITSYYDELALVRAKRISKESYLELLGQLCTRVYSIPGRFRQTLEQASFEAWTKFYKPDENSLNATISYYTKGALVALALDLLLRHKTNNQCSLDKVMQIVWQRFGLTNEGLPENVFEKIAEEVSGCSLEEFFNMALRSVEEFPIATYLELAGIILNAFPATSVEETGGKKPSELINKPLLEVKLKTGTSDVHLASIYEGGAAEAAGLAPGDIIVAVNGFKVERSRFESVIASFAVGEEVLLHVFRRDELMTFKITLRGGWLQTYSLMISPTLTEQQQALLNSWLQLT